MKTAASIEDVKFQHNKRGDDCCSRVFNTLNVRSFILVLSLLYLLLEVTKLQVMQESGGILRQAYPDCHIDHLDWLGDGICNMEEYNTEECGWDDGDCLIDEYPDCHVLPQKKLVMDNVIILEDLTLKNVDGTMEIAF